MGCAYGSGTTQVFLKKYFCSYKRSATIRYVQFEWEEAKARSNLRKHGISFELAVRVFADECRMERLDGCRSDEERWITTGLVEGTEMVIAYTLRGDVVRLISARRAERYEREEYWRGAV